jgi:hypothetical protein
VGGGGKGSIASVDPILPIRHDDAGVFTPNFRSLPINAGLPSGDDPDRELVENGLTRELDVCSEDDEPVLAALRPRRSTTLSGTCACRPVSRIASLTELSIWNGTRLNVLYCVTSALNCVAFRVAPIASYGNTCSSGVVKLFAPGSISVDVVEAAGERLESRGCDKEELIWASAKIVHNIPTIAKHRLRIFRFMEEKLPLEIEA